MVKNSPAMQEPRETWVRSLGWEDLEKGMATHSGILACRIPWTEKPGRPQFMRSQRDIYTFMFIAALFTIAIDGSKPSIY